MTKPKRKPWGTSELEALRYQVEQLQDQVRKERRQRVLVEEELAIARQQADQVRRRLNGVAA
jgi:hypothetical protein